MHSCWQSIVSWRGSFKIIQRKLHQKFNELTTEMMSTSQLIICIIYWLKKSCDVILKCLSFLLGKALYLNQQTVYDRSCNLRVRSSSFVRALARFSFWIQANQSPHYKSCPRDWLLIRSLNSLLVNLIPQNPVAGFNCHAIKKKKTVW